MTSTQFATATNPWASLYPDGKAPIPKPTTKATAMPKVDKRADNPGFRPRIDIDTLTIEDVPPPASRKVANKYDLFFAKLKVGQCVKCTPDQVGPIGNSMRSWLKRHKKPGSVMAARVCDDGFGRVWWIAPVAAANDKQARRAA